MKATTITTTAVPGLRFYKNLGQNVYTTCKKRDLVTAIRTNSQSGNLTSRVGFGAVVLENSLHRRSSSIWGRNLLTSIGGQVQSKRFYSGGNGENNNSTSDAAAALWSSDLYTPFVPNLLDFSVFSVGLSWSSSLFMMVLGCRLLALPLTLYITRARKAVHNRQSIVDKLKKMQCKIQENDKKISKKGIEELEATETGITKQQKQYAAIKNTLMLLKSPLNIAPFACVYELCYKYQGAAANPLQNISGHERLISFTQDLTTSDPTYILPVMTSITAVAFVQVAGRNMLKEDNLTGTIRFVQGACLFVIPGFAMLPSAMLVYLMSNCSLFTLQHVLMKTSYMQEFVERWNAKLSFEVAKDSKNSKSNQVGATEYNRNRGRQQQNPKASSNRNKLFSGRLKSKHKNLK